MNKQAKSKRFEHVLLGQERIVDTSIYLRKNSFHLFLALAVVRQRENAFNKRTSCAFISNYSLFLLLILPLDLFMWKRRMNSEQDWKEVTC